MAWIQVRNDLPEDPRVLRTAHILGCPLEQALGCYVRLWIVADVHTTDGRLNMPDAAVDLLVHCKGFAAAARAVDWLGVDEAGMCYIPRFKDRNGKSAKQRVLAAIRQQKKRGKLSRNSNAASVTEALRERDQEQHQQQESDKKPIAQARKGHFLAGLAADAGPEALLKACGIGGRPLARLVAGGVTSERVRALADEAWQRNGQIHNPAGMIAAALSEEFGVRLGKSALLDSDRSALDAVSRRRAQLRGG